MAQPIDPVSIGLDEARDPAIDAPPGAGRFYERRLSELFLPWELSTLPDLSDHVRDLSIPPPVPPLVVAMSRAYPPNNRYSRVPPIPSHATSLDE
jgi:hypothetical protein